jgi:hypothetical protein
MRAELHPCFQTLKNTSTGFRCLAKVLDRNAAAELSDSNKDNLIPNPEITHLKKSKGED